MILLQSYHIFLFMKCFFFQLYDGEFLSMKIISFTFHFTFLNKATFKDKTHMILVQGLCRNLKQIKNGKKNGTGYSFQRKKMFCVACRKHQEKLKKMLDFTEAFILGSNNFKKSGLSDHVKGKMQV